jgi:predicted NBD/HSP70 family sugar kinase
MATTSHIRRLNQRQVVMSLLRQRRASRADLAKSTGMSQPTVGRIVDDLIAGQILADAGPGDAVADQTMLGRPSQLLELDSKHHRFAAIQIGVKTTRIAILPANIADTDKWDIEIPTAGNARDWALDVADGWTQLADDDVELLLLSVPGVVDERLGRVLMSANVRWIQDIPLLELLQSAKLPATPRAVVIVQEIRALALGHLAVEPASRDFLLVDFGNGVGAAAVVGGELYGGSLALSGEIGHTPVLGNVRKCGCGSIGCVETLVSRDGLLAAVSRVHPSVKTWPQLLDHVERTGVESWLENAIGAIAVTIAGALNVLGLRHVVLTGSVTEFPPIVAEQLSAAIVRGAMWARFGKISVITAPRRRTAGLVSTAIDRLLMA